MEYKRFRTICDELAETSEIVLDRDTAIDFLTEMAITYVKDRGLSNWDAEEIGQVITETVQDIENIERETEWKWVKISECPMAGNNISVVPMWESKNE